jgi:hypothetical protein
MVVGCTDRTPAKIYSETVKKELASGKKADHLLLDIKFGMTRKEFFNYCWEMHQSGQFEDGSNSTAVLYRIGKGLKYPASMNFYPDFYQDTVYKMWALFNYDAWAPWNKQLFSDSLLPEVLDLYKKWYPGNDFIKMTDQKKRTIYVKVDGNRRIVVGRSDDIRVRADFTDLLVEPKIKK